MKIALVSIDFYPDVGGVAAHVVELGKALARQNHDVHVVAIPCGTERSPESTLHGMTVHRPSIPKQKPIYSWMTHRWLQKFIQNENIDAVHVHGMRPLEATKNLAAPVIFTNHTSGFLKRIQKGPAEHRKLARRLSHISHVLAPSQELVDATLTVGYHGPVTFISNGVDTERFTPGPATFRDEWGVKDDEVVILLARRLVEKNGVTVFAEALAKLAETDLKFRAVFAGDGAERGAVTDILTKGNAIDSSVFLGNVLNENMPGIYRSADISVLPSFMEATSITGLESMACGLPLVGTRVGGIPVLIDDEKSGLLVEPGDPAGLAKAIHRLAADAQLRRRMGDEARQRAAEQFSWDRIANETVAIYQQCSELRATA
jgi:glycosyltransferase involved in cell wall biosynthesis